MTAASLLAVGMGDVTAVFLCLTEEDFGVLWCEREKPYFSGLRSLRFTLYALCCRKESSVLDSLVC